MSKATSQRGMNIFISGNCRDPRRGVHAIGVGEEKREETHWGVSQGGRGVPPCRERGGMNYLGGARCHVDRVVRGHAVTCRPGGATLSNGF